MSEVTSETLSESVPASTKEPTNPPVPEVRSRTVLSPTEVLPKSLQVAETERKGLVRKHTTSTRFNATKHGLLAAGITELDDSDGYRDMLCQLRRDLLPIGIREEFLVKWIARDMVRVERGGRLEAEHITEVINPPIHEDGPFAALDHLDEGPLVDPGIPATMHYEGVRVLVNTFQRYITAASLSVYFVICMSSTGRNE